MSTWSPAIFDLQDDLVGPLADLGPWRREREEAGTVPDDEHAVEADLAEVQLRGRLPNRGAAGDLFGLLGEDLLGELFELAHAGRRSLVGGGGLRGRGGCDAGFFDEGVDAGVEGGEVDGAVGEECAEG